MFRLGEFLEDMHDQLETVRQEVKPLLPYGKRKQSPCLLKELKYYFECEKKCVDISQLKHFVIEGMSELSQLDDRLFRSHVEKLKDLILATQPNKRSTRVVLCNFSKLFREFFGNLDIFDPDNISKLAIVKEVMRVGKDIDFDPVDYVLKSNRDPLDSIGECFDF